MDKLISVIIPVYNVEKYLNRCLQSVVNQTYTNLEIILVDDGSPDNCSRLCDDWAKKDDRIKVIHQNNQGLSGARNTGLAYAKGDYIGFVDSDDWIVPDMYKTLYELCEANRAQIACGDIVRCGRYDPKLLVEGKTYVMDKKELQEQIPTEKFYSKQQYMKKYFKIHSQETVHYMVNKLYKRETAQQIHFPEGLIDEDVEGFFQALLYADTIAVTSQILYFYWENQEGISAKWFTHKQMDLLTVWEHVCELSDNTGNPQWKKWAGLNYDRAYLGLLCRMLLNEPTEDVIYEEERKKLLNGLKKRYVRLFFSSIPLSRKMIMTLICMNYRWAKKVVNWRRR